MLKMNYNRSAKYNAGGFHPALSDTIQLRKLDEPVQLNPFPVYPVLQTQLKLPTVFVQLAFGLHPPLLTRHSSTSVREMEIV